MRDQSQRRGLHLSSRNTLWPMQSRASLCEAGWVLTPHGALCPECKEAFSSVFWSGCSQTLYGPLPAHILFRPGRMGKGGGASFRGAVVAVLPANVTQGWGSDSHVCRLSLGIWVGRGIFVLWSRRTSISTSAPGSSGCTRLDAGRSSDRHVKSCLFSIYYGPGTTFHVLTDLQVTEWH